MGSVHQVLQFVTHQAGVINREQDLSGIRVGLHDEIFHDGKPVLTGVDAASTYCYLLVAAQHRDADTWGVHLLDATEQGLKPDYTIADAGQGLRAGQKAAWGGTPSHGYFRIRVTTNCGISWLFNEEPHSLLSLCNYGRRVHIITFAGDHHRWCRFIAARQVSLQPTAEIGVTQIGPQ